MILTFDVGGTKTMWTLWENSAAVRRDTVPTEKINDFTKFIEEIIRKCTNSLDTICFALAGPVSANKFQLTNTGQILDFTRIRTSFPQIRQINFINDLEALAHSLPYLKDENQLLPYAKITPFEDAKVNASNDPANFGAHQINGAKAVLSVGTGLGVAAVTREGIVVPSEGGHIDFAPQSDIQQKLYEHLSEKYDHVSYERLLSGQGLVNIYNFVINTIPDTVTNLNCNSKQDIAPAEISNLAESGNKDALETFRIFSEILGAACGNYALTFMASGGIYLGGGMMPKILKFIDKDSFTRALAAKGRFAEYTGNLPVYIITDETTPSIGAMAYSSNNRL